MKLRFLVFVLFAITMHTSFGAEHLRKDKPRSCLSGRNPALKVGSDCPYPVCPFAAQMVTAVHNLDGLYVHKHVGSDWWYNPEGDRIRFS